MVDINEQVRHLKRDDFYKYMEGKVEVLFKSCDQKLEPPTIAKSVADYILKYKNKMDIGQIDDAFRRGLEGEFDKLSKVNFRVIIQWVSKVNSERQHKDAKEELTTESTPMHQRVQNMVWSAMDYRKEAKKEFEERAPNLCAYMDGKVTIGKEL